MASSYQNAVDFRRLPSELQERLIALQADGEDHFIYPKSVSLIWLAPIIAALAWLVYVYSATQQPLWENWMSYVVGGVSVIVFPLAFYGLGRLVKPRLSKIKAGFMVTKDEFIKVSGNCLQLCGLKDVEALRFKEDLQEIEVWIGGHEETIKVTDSGKAMKLDRLFDQWKEGAGAGIREQSAEKKYAFNRTRGTLAVAAGMLAAIALGLLVARGSAAVNRGFDDQQTWGRAEQLNSIEEFENYKARHPNGAHKSDAQQRIADSLAKIKDSYVTRASKEASPDAVKAMSTLLTNASVRPDRMVYVKVSEDRQLDNAVVEELRRAAGTSLYDYETSVPRGGEEFRKNKVFSDIQVMMNSSLGRGVVNLQLADDPPADLPVIEAMLQIKPDKTIYRIANYIDGRMHTDLYAGANFTFQINIQPGGSDEPYHMEYSGQPMQLSPTIYDRRDKENFTFDKVYFSAVTDGFDQTLARTFGFVGGTTVAQ